MTYEQKVKAALDKVKAPSLSEAVKLGAKLVKT